MRTGRLPKIATRLQQLVMGPAEEAESRENSTPSVEELSREIVIKVLQKIQNTEESLPQTGRAAAVALEQFQESAEEQQEKKRTHLSLWQRVVGMQVVKRRLRQQVVNEVTEILKSRAHFITSETCSVAKTAQQIAAIVMSLHEEEQLTPETLTQDARDLLEQVHLTSAKGAVTSIARKIELSLKNPEKKILIFLETLIATKQKIEDGSTWGLYRNTDTDLPQEVKDQTNLICSISNEVTLNPVRLSYGPHIYDINTLIQYVESCIETSDNPFPLEFVWPNTEIGVSGSAYYPNHSWDQVITAADDEELASSLKSMQMLLIQYCPEIKTWKEHEGTKERAKQLDGFIAEQPHIQNWRKTCPISGKLIHKPMRIIRTTEPVFCANSLKELASRLEQSADGSLSIGDYRFEIARTYDSDILNIIQSVEYDPSTAVRLQNDYTRDHKIWSNDYQEQFGSADLSRIEELREYILEGTPISVLRGDYSETEIEQAGAPIRDIRGAASESYSGPSSP